MPQAIRVEGGAGEISPSSAEVDAPPWPKGEGFLRNKIGVVEGGMLRQARNYWLAITARL